MKKYTRYFCLIGMGFLLAAGYPQNAMASAEAKLEEDQHYIRVGCSEYEPYSYFDENGNLTGIDAELAEEAFSRMGYEPMYVLMKWTEKDSFLENDVIDCIWDAYAMNGREDTYCWSEPYMSSREVVVVKDDSDIQTLADLDGRKIATLANTSEENLLLEKKVFPYIELDALYSFQYMNEALAALKLDYVDAVACDKLYIEKYMENYPGKLRFIKESLETTSLSVAFPKDSDPEFVEQLNEILREMKLDGTTDKILAKYQIEQGVNAEDTDSE